MVAASELRPPRTPGAWRGQVWTADEVVDAFRSSEIFPPRPADHDVPVLPAEG